MTPTPLIDYGQALDDLAREAAEITEAKGFLDNDFDELSQVFVKAALIGTEVSELLAVHRDAYDDDEEDPISRMTPAQEDDFVEELADIFIRGFDLAGYLELPLGAAVIAKMQKNRSRPKKHGKRY